MTRVTRPEYGENTGVARSPLTAIFPSVSSSLTKLRKATSSTVSDFSCWGVARKVPGGELGTGAGSSFLPKSLPPSQTAPSATMTAAAPTPAALICRFVDQARRAIDSRPTGNCGGSPFGSLIHNSLKNCDCYMRRSGLLVGVGTVGPVA